MNVGLSIHRNAVRTPKAPAIFGTQAKNYEEFYIGNYKGRWKAGIRRTMYLRKTVNISVTATLLIFPRITLTTRTEYLRAKKISST